MIETLSSRFNRWAMTLIALALAVVAVVAWKLGLVSPQWALAAFNGLAFVAGAVTITYKYPTAPLTIFSGTVPPTAAQAANFNELSALVNYADSDTQIILIHNWGIDSVHASRLFPLVDGPNLNSDATTTVLPIWTINPSGNTNQVTFVKATTVGTQGTAIITLLRPNSLIE